AVSGAEAKPNKAQYDYHELERIMFVCLDPCTWQGREYDNHTTDMKDMKLPKLDVNQWCEAAKSWGANEILLVTKHTGGFCWWQTTTSDYSVKNIAWKDGKGDMVDEVAKACKKHGLKLGLYIYPGDDQWGAKIGSGGITSDPKKQAAYNKIFRTQWTELLSRYSDNVIELWFDGSCKIPVSDIFNKYVGDNVVYLQGPNANLRWVGTESGVAPYPGWNTLDKKDLDTGVSTAVHGDPDGDAWAGLECDTTLYDHNWFWAKKNERKRKSLQHLIKLYYQSVGRGATFLLNSTPNTDGLIPDGDIARYKEFGKELDRRFSTPLGEIRGKGLVHSIKFDTPTKINQFMIMEDYREGHRIREFVVEARTADGNWVEVNSGTAVGRKRIVVFEPIDVTAVTLRVTKNVNEPLIRDFKVYFVEGDNSFLHESSNQDLVSKSANATASDTHSAPYAPGKICDGNHETWWGVSTQVKAPLYEAWVELDLGKDISINETVINEPWNRTEKFQLEYRSSKDKNWQVAFKDGKMGPGYSSKFKAITARYWRLNLLKSNHYPSIKEWELFGSKSGQWNKCFTVAPKMFKWGKAEVEIDISKFITQPGQYLIRIDNVEETPIAVKAIDVIYDGHAVHEEVLSPVKKDEIYLLNRHAQVTYESKIVLSVKLTGGNKKSKIDISIKREL
ncbi:MAG: alpha-L-fucosidase, partial [Kiritimatiellae bacterium]|nr:alpha-L-fucosidase [Kiritimatiellia bacterium]